VFLEYGAQSRAVRTNLAQVDEPLVRRERVLWFDRRKKRGTNMHVNAALHSEVENKEAHSQGD
jgi:hypothetical protein